MSEEQAKQNLEQAIENLNDARIADQDLRTFLDACNVAWDAWAELFSANRAHFRWGAVNDV